MKLDDFITGVLIDIDSGIQNAGLKTDRRYYVAISDNKGVSFDIAVTTVSSEGTKAEGKAKVGLIEVLGAGVGAQLEKKKENSEVSRIKFTVLVPSQTKSEEVDRSRQLQQSSQSFLDQDTGFGY